MNLVDTIKLEHEDNNNYSYHNGLTVRNGVNMNLYGIEKRNTIENACLMFSHLDDTLDYCSTHGLMYVTSADVPGYMNEGYSTVHAYNGKYGKGVVRTRPCFYRGRRSTKYMTIEYWVKRRIK